MAKASARHILVPTEEECNELKLKIEAGADFKKIAESHSKCPSGKKGGGLGEFSPGAMVPAFDKVIFSAELGKVHGPVKTDFGYHLIEITSRTGNGESPDKQAGDAEKEGAKEDAESEKADIDYCETIYAISKEIKGLGCRDFFFFKPLEADSKLVNAYQDHINSIQTFLKSMEKVDASIKKQVQVELLLRLKLVIKEMKEKIIGPVQKATKGDDEIKTFTGYAVKWNNQLDEIDKIDIALNNKYEYGKPMKINLDEVGK